MIRPKPKGRQIAPRLVSIALTLGLLFGAAAGLRATSLPAFASGRQMIRELDALILERFAFVRPPEEAPVEEEVEQPPEEVEDVSFDDEVGAAVEGLGDLFGGAETPPPTGADRTTAETAATPGGIEAAADAGRFESLFGGDEGVATRRPGAGRRAPVREGSGGIGIGINERLADAAVDSAAAAPPDPATPGVAVQTGTERSSAPVPTVAISEFEAESFDGSEAQRLAAWMRANPAPLPVGVQVHVNYESAFLTSAVPFESNGSRWELYLMFNEALRELHIVLVEGDRSVYLIDRGFQEQSRSLREGTVRRAGGRIVAVDSRTGAASSERASEFYNVFLSWWETAKADAG